MKKTTLALSLSLLFPVSTLASATPPLTCASYHKTNKEILNYSHAINLLASKLENDEKDLNPHYNSAVCEANHMNRVLSELTNLYKNDPVIIFALNRFRSLKSQIEGDLFAKKLPFDWSSKQSILSDQIKLLHLISEGREKSNHLDLEHALLPYAVTFLKANPNNPVICQSLQKLGYNTDGLELAEQAAFMTFGEKYCRRTYNNLKAWGGSTLGKSHNELKQPAVGDLPPKYQAYYMMTYRDYYNKHVKPKISEAKRMLASTINYQNICYSHAQSVLRDPDQDALRQAYLLKGYKDCKFATQKYDTFKHTVGCLMACKHHTPRGFIEDCIEKCKWSTGVLFG